MKAIVLCCIIATVVVVVFAAPPEKKDLKQIKEAKKCLKNCDAIGVKAICAGEEGQKPLSFGSLCVMENYNCENNKKLKKIADGECPGNTGIRLS